MDSEQCKTKILGFGFSILEGVDPNKDNFVCASILHTREAQVGCLMRLEPNMQAQVYLLLYTIFAVSVIIYNDVCDVTKFNKFKIDYVAINGTMLFPDYLKYYFITI